MPVMHIADKTKWMVLEKISVNADQSIDSLIDDMPWYDFSLNIF